MYRCLSIGIALACATLGLSVECPAFSQGMQKPVFEVYPAPTGVMLSPQYTIKITQAGLSGNSPVYQTQNPAFLPNGQPSGAISSSTREQDTAWTSFSANAPVVVQITPARPFQSVRILPSHAHIVATVTGGVVSFPMSDTGQRQVAVDFCTTSAVCDDTTDTDVSHPLLVFANRLPDKPSPGALLAMPGSAVPSIGDHSMVYFGPGLYDLGTTPYVLGSNQTALLAGGAYVKGMFAIADGATGTVVAGQGIVSGEEIEQSSCPQPRNLCPPMVGGADIMGNVRIEGITLVNSPFYNIAITGDHNEARDIKVLAWLGNTDGITIAGGADPSGSSIRDSFFKVGDDAIKLFSNNLLVSGCTIWQLNNAAAFEFGVNEFVNLSNIVVENADVIRTEETYATRSNAVFSAALGGDSAAGGYIFRHIRVENADFQLFKLAEIPNQYTKPGNDSLGSLSNLTFSDIDVTDPQILPNLFQSFDVLHRVNAVTFRHVTVAGQALHQPALSFNANRNFSLGGTVFSSLLSRSTTQPGNFQIALFSSAAGGVPSSIVSVNNAALTAHFQFQAVGDFFGNGNASVLVRDPDTGELRLWLDPLLSGGLSAINDPAGSTQRDEKVAGVGDFNGDGRSDILLWNAGTGAGRILLMDGTRVTGRIAVQPATPSRWNVAGIGDINQTGFSDIILRDQSGNVEIIIFGHTGVVGITDLAPSAFYYDSTPQYDLQWPAITGHFDQSWTIAGVADVMGDGYAGILWVNGAGDVGLTSFAFAEPNVLSGRVFARLPSSQDRIAALGDFNGDDTTDILLQDTESGAATIWYTGYFGGGLYEVGPTLSPTSGYQFQE